MNKPTKKENTHLNFINTSTKKKTSPSTSEAMLNQENPAFSGGALKKSGGFP